MTKEHFQQRRPDQRKSLAGNSAQYRETETEPKLRLELPQKPE